MPLKVICLGKTKESWIKQGIEEYRKRLTGQWTVDWQELKDVSLSEAGSIESVKSKEAKIIQKALKEDTFLVALDERGTSFSSVDFAGYLDKLSGKEVTFVIGGVYGLDKTILDRAGLSLSFSSFTFPHQLIRLMLIEQLYRCQTIRTGKTYHY